MSIPLTPKLISPRTRSSVGGNNTYYDNTNHDQDDFDYPAQDYGGANPIYEASNPYNEPSDPYNEASDPYNEASNPYYEASDQYAYEEGEAYDVSPDTDHYASPYAYERPTLYKQGTHLQPEGDFGGTSEVKSAYRAYDSYRKPKVSHNRKSEFAFTS